MSIIPNHTPMSSGADDALSQALMDRDYWKRRAEIAEIECGDAASAASEMASRWQEAERRARSPSVAEPLDDGEECK